jgi:hypothetical protein
VSSCTKSRCKTGIRRFTAGLMLILLWLGAFAAATFPELHNWIHEDAQSPTHECFVTQVDQQSFLTSAGIVFVVIIPTLVVFRLSWASHVLAYSTGDHRISRGRPPPDGFASITVAG